MKKLKILILIILFNLVTFKSTQACDLLGVEIGGDTSTVGFLSQLDQEDIDADDSVTIFQSETSAFCKDVDFGITIIKGYITNNGIVGAVEIVVQNNKNNTESKRGLLRNFVKTNFGDFNIESDEWQGYKKWNIGPKQIFYYYSEIENKPTKEGVVVTSDQYYNVLLVNEYEN